MASLGHDVDIGLWLALQLSAFGALKTLGGLNRGH